MELIQKIKPDLVIGDFRLSLAPGLRLGMTSNRPFLVTLDPDSYTVVLRGKNNRTGIALAEVYRMP